MADTGDVSRTLKEALIETLNAILSHCSEVRANAEEQLKMLEVTDGYGVHLAELTVEPYAPFAVRQLSSVLLKQYVDTHWSADSERFRPPEASDEAKARIRSLLPMTLKESLSKLRSSCAYAISAIAHYDWPDGWPQLFEILMQALTSGDGNMVHGAMRVLTEFSREITDSRMGDVAPIILPEMYKIFTNPEKYSIRTRGRALEIFATCAEMISVMGQSDKTSRRTLLYPVLPQFVQALVQALKMPDGSASDGGLKKEILNVLSVLLKNESKQMAAYLPHILPPVWDCLTNSASTYVKTVVNDTEEADDPVDSDGEVLGFENLVFSIFEFVNVLMESSRNDDVVKKGLTALLYYIIMYMQVTEEQARTWTNNPDQFVEDEDDDTFSYSVRISAQDLLVSLVQEFENDCLQSLCEAIGKHIQEANMGRESGDVNWWKIHESCMLALGTFRDEVLEKIQTKELQFDFAGFLNSVVLADLNHSNSPFLIGRCLWIASRFAVSLSSDTIQRFLQATESALQVSQPPTIRISAVRAVWGFCEYLKNTEQTNILLPYLAPFLEGLLSLATQFYCEVLALVLEAISVVICVDKKFTASVEGRVSPIAIAVFLKHNSDPVLVSLAQDIFKELSTNAACQAPLQQRLLPTLISILQAPLDKIPSGLQAVALDVLQTLIRSSTPPVSDALISQAFPVAAHCILHSDDCSVLQNGGECMRAYVSVALEQITNWRDEQGQSGLLYVIKVAQFLLDPKVPESSAAFAGRLVSVLISKAGSALGEGNDLLLRAVLSKLQQTETPTVVQSLVLVFAHLVHTQMPGVLDFLAGLPGPEGHSALAYVLTEWCSKQALFYNSFENKVSILALCKLLEHGIKTNDPRLVNITTRGDLVVNSNEGIKTRSKSVKCPDQWTEIPILVKIYKLIINELRTWNEQQGDEGEDDTDSEDEGNWDDEDGGKMDDAMSAANILGSFMPASKFPGYDEGVDEDDDPDALADPLFHVNLKTYVVQFLQGLVQQPCFAMFSQHHTQVERQTLMSIGLNV